MSWKISYFMIVFLLFSIPSSISQSQTFKPQEQAFKFLQNLKEVHKGQTVVGLDEVKKFLIRFGYYPNSYDTRHLNNYFDDQLKFALKKYQKFFRLNITGSLGSETIQKMMIPRCGVPDITDFTSLNQSRDSIIGPLYAFPAGMPKWNKFNLTYVFLPNVPNSKDVRAAFAQAFVNWQIGSPFRFHEAAAGEIQDLHIGFYTGDHGDGSPFDGPGNVLAHSFYPSDGRTHYDATENWSTNPASNQVDVESVAVHEIGHLLGLAHSQDPKAVMYPTIQYGVIKRVLSPDDVQGIQTLYPKP
ncbi:metalloendoproteinase 2-MMP [Manihot esculenta]|uniref:Uncharacterized protein n=2 Tax=Manihot esculenta TaxID=3983 RepID=A0ACB7G6F9_MANES|nr:metalloendoproteinase 2-MMP [Manihot esculenta]KAG8635118.1 hypothetical protein MANES_17G119514v8 [Manihot esculenta]